MMARAGKVMLATQIKHAIQLVNNAIYDDSQLRGYYNSIVNKIGNHKKNSNEETNRSIAAKEFKKRFNSADDFVNTILEKDIVFVFEYRPLEKHTISDPES